MIAVVLVVALLASFAHVEDPAYLCAQGRMTLLYDCKHHTDRAAYSRAALDIPPSGSAQVLP
jgi:hypothetical protein